MEISAKMVKELRELTGAGMMDCKKALKESAGDQEKAIAYLREHGVAKAASKEGRKTAEGTIATYVHPGDKLGVMVEINCETDFVARNDLFKTFCKDIAMHIAAANPLCVAREEADQSLIEKEREMFRNEMLNEGKPEKIIDKIVDGKIEKYLSEIVLLEQPFVKNNDVTIGELLKSTIVELGENMGIKRFTRFRLGE